MTIGLVQTIEIRDGDGWRPEYLMGAFKDGDPKNLEKGNFYWKTVVWDIEDKWSRANAHDRVLHTNGGHFNIYKFRFVEMPFDPEKHHLTEKKKGI
jgi:hypothetical protein